MSDDMNGMSMEELMLFAQGEALPERLKEGELEDPNASKVETNANALSAEDLLAMTQGQLVGEEEEEVSTEASEDELMAMLENTVGEDEIITGDEPENIELAANIEKIKLRQLANRIETMAPPKMFPPRKDEIYYFITSMARQSATFNIENANEKCAFIGNALKSLHAFMITEINLSFEEVELLTELFASFSVERVDESQARERIQENFKFGWKQMAKMLYRDIDKLKKGKGDKNKPFWMVVKYYEALVSAFGLARAQEDTKMYKNDVQLQIDKDQKRLIVSMFEDVMDISKYYGLKIPPYMNRKEAYQSLHKLDLNNLLARLKETQKRKR